jgi:aminoglycoside/choline kinase family phosphotransferase
MADAASAISNPNETLAFVSAAIAERWPTARATGVRSLRGDASSRAYSRVTIDRGRSDAAPESLVVMHLSDRAVAISSEELGVFGKGGPAELPFVNVHRYLAKLSDAVPAIYARSADGKMLVLEDVGDLTLWEAAQASKDGGRALFRQALEWTAALQSEARDDGACYALRQAFDTRLFAWEFDHFVEYGLAGLPSAKEAGVRRELSAAAAKLGALPRVLCHRDYHAWNIHVQNGARLRVIDFQDALLGPRLYDAASLLTDRTTPDLIHPVLERELVLGLAERLGLDLWRDEVTLLAEYRLIALQRALKVVGRFNYLAEVKGKPGYLSMLPNAAATARRQLAALGSFPETEAALAANGKTGDSAARPSA